MEFVKPQRLIPGRSVIGLIAPSGIVEKEGLEKGMKILRDWGFFVKLGRHVLKRRKDYSAGTEEERWEDFLEMILDKKVGAVGCITGGFAASELLRYFNKDLFKFLRKEPKIFFGYSDFSLILNALFAYGIIGLHAPNIEGLPTLWSQKSKKSLFDWLTGKAFAEIDPPNRLKAVLTGSACGRLLVSNLECLIHIQGTRFDPLTHSYEDLIIALEERNEEKGEIKRWLERLILHPKSKIIRGIILGRFVGAIETEYVDWGKNISVAEIFAEVFSRGGIPIATGLEFGHTEAEDRTAKENFSTLPVGVKVELKVEKEKCRLRFLEKALARPTVTSE